MPMEALRWPCRNTPITTECQKLIYHSCKSLRSNTLSVIISKSNQWLTIHLMVFSTCPGLGLVAALLGRARGSDWVMVLSLLARSRWWEWSEGRGSVWALSFLLGTNFGDSKKGTGDGGVTVRGRR